MSEHKAKEEASKDELDKLAKEAEELLDLEQFDFSLPDTKAVANLWGTLLWQQLQNVHQLDALIYGNRAAKNQPKVDQLTLDLLAAKHSAAQIQKEHKGARAAMLDILADKK